MFLLDTRSPARATKFSLASWVLIFCMSALDTLGIVYFTVGVGETENEKSLLARVRGPGDFFFGSRRVSG